MDRERKKFWRTIKLVVTETIMVISAIILVVVLTFIAMGYNVNNDGEVGQQGLLQINSHPTGAIVNIDGGDILPHTNTSKLLSAGEHTIRLTKEGYDSWEKKIVSEPGILFKLDYPRLFLQDRVPEKMREYDAELAFFEPAPNHDSILYALKGDELKWNLLDIRGDSAIDSLLDMSTVMQGLSVENIVWNNNSDRVIVAAKNSKLQREWLLIDVKDLKNSVNLSREFGLDFSRVMFATDSGDRLFTLENNNLRMVTASGKTISQIIASNVTDFVINGNDVMYVKDDNQVMLLRDGGGDIPVAKFDSGQIVRVALSEYIGKKYIVLATDDQLYIYRGDYPDGERELKDMELVLDQSLQFKPDAIKIEAGGELIVMKSGGKVAVFDAELTALYQYELASDQLFFVDFYLIGTIENDKLVVRDFDDTNRRELTTATSTAIITKNNKWLYYLRLDNSKINIFREQILD